MHHKKAGGPASPGPSVPYYSSGNQSMDLVTRILALLGNRTPSLKQRQIVETLLFNISFKAELLFDQRLTQRERACLALAALGYNKIETAELLALSRNTVESYHKMFKKKRRCKTIV